MSSPTALPLNIIFFGSTGTGKSSMINMLLGEDRALTSSGAKGCTFNNNAYPTTIEGKNYRLYDTSGLDQGSAGTVISKDALRKLYHLVRDLKDGVSLLVYCIQGRPITDTLERNYEIFYDGICCKSVPIVVVVTGLEDQTPDMDAWWKENDTHIESRNMRFDGHACVTATLGKKVKGVFRNQTEYDSSKTALRNLIVKNCRSNPWQKDTTAWFTTVANWLYRSLRSEEDRVDPLSTDLFEVLKQFLSDKDALEIVNQADMTAPDPKS
ncbi:hypothetical protein D9757_002166 [Collybiopsis confluens]|uniref:G domain-containing protein n=1 Tax=Collybiopsis confluens TaxID=2823264 RepID=A0A8H5MFJ7_9AGAR|nr:hypothetical protein D9757_002166 [Collybiopsis confluens]